MAGKVVLLPAKPGEALFKDSGLPLRATPPLSMELI